MFFLDVTVEVVNDQLPYDSTTRAYHLDRSNLHRTGGVLGSV